MPARAAGDNGVLPAATLPNKPEVTIQGNVVVDEGGAPTGFYELALCVRSPRRIVGPSPADWTTVKELSEAEYAQVLAAIENGTAVGVTENNYKVTYYPFSAASAVVNVNTDVLTAVHWDVAEVKYAAWDAANSTYAANDTVYPRGVDTAASADPAVWGDTDPDAFPDVTAAKLNTKLDSMTVALDAEGDRSAFTAAAEAVHYYEDADSSTKAAVVTLSAHAPDNKPVVYKTTTPVAVVRFSYDLKRFPKGLVKANETYNAANPTDQITGDSGPTAAAGFWLGLDRETGNLLTNGKTPITWLADTGMDEVGSKPFSFSDALAAKTDAAQVVWTKLSSKDTAGGYPGWDQTEYYYYLGASNATAAGSNASDPDGTVPVRDAATNTITDVEHIKIPDTVGEAVLGHGTEENPAPAAGDAWTTAEYSYYSNLLYLGEGLKLRLVNDLTFKKPTGGTGGNIILFYDWDDTLIGSMVVGDGDVRAQVNAYIEKNMVHPDLRVGDILKNDLGGAVPDYAAGAPGTGTPSEKYKNVLDSLDREYTYRGKYPYELGGSAIQDDATALPGSEYPLTNKLDYAFYRHLNTVTTQEYADATTGATVTDRYVTADKLSTNQDAAQYPWVYGWAVVEETSSNNNKEWQVRRDAMKREDVWTTFGVGELSSLDPSFDLSAPGAQAIPTALPGTPVTGTTVGGGTGIETTWPAFIDPATATAPTDYSYKLSSAGDARYLRFADFSDIGSEYTRPGQDTLVVKAVYEPGTELMAGSSYQVTKEPAYNKLNRKSASEGGAYSATITLERVTGVAADGILRGASRVRDPAVRQDNTYDQKWIIDNLLGVDHNLINADIETAKKLTETLFTKVDVLNGDEVSFTLPLSARHNKVDYWLIDMYGSNFVSGDQRSTTNFNQYGSAHVLDNYNYDSEDRVTADSYYDKQNYYYQVPNYEDRDGSHGFVLHGTLNALMEQATLVAKGQAQTSDMNAAANYMILRDANLRLDAGGTLPTAATQMAVQTKIINAAKACEAYKGNPDYWNDDLDCAQLSYHQLQWYIIDGTLYSRAAADAKTLPFCHLHKACAALVSNKPKDWPDLIDKAKTDPDAIDDLRMDEVEAMTHLRRDLNGTAFPNTQSFKLALTAAVNAGCTTWDEIQYCIIHSGALPTDDTEARSSYWWYDGATSNPAPSSFSALYEAAKPTFTDQTYPDGSKHTSEAKLNAAQATFDRNAAADPDAVDSAWVSMTHNLVKGHAETVVGEGDEQETVFTTTKFASFDEFKTAYLAAVRDPSVTDPATQWQEVQLAILKQSDPADTGGDPAFWWKDGKTPLKVINIRTLLQAAALANSADPAEQTLGNEALSKLTVATLSGEPYYLRATQKGGALAGAYASDADLLTAIKAAQAAGANDWNTLQYYLVHKRIDPDTSVMDREAKYYWWKAGGTGTEVDFNSAVTLNLTIKAFQEAALRGNEFGDPKAIASVEKMKDLDGKYTLLHLTPTNPATQVPEVTKFADMDWYSDTSTLLADLAAMQELIRQKTGVTDPLVLPTINWYQAQWYLLNGTYLDPANADDVAAAKEAYWWYDKTEKPAPPPVGEPTAAMVDMIATVVNDGDIYADFIDNVDANVLKSWGLTYLAPGVTIADNFDDFILGFQQLEYLVYDFQGGGFFDEGVNLTWAQIQYYLASAWDDYNNGGDGYGIPETHENALAGLEALGWTDYPDGAIVSRAKSFDRVKYMQAYVRKCG